MREAFRVDYLLMKDAQSSHSKSWDIPNMLDKFLTGENVKVNGEIGGRLHILRTLAGLSTLSKVGGYFEEVGGER
jgi:hypothetical protein